MSCSTLSPDLLEIADAAVYPSAAAVGQDKDPHKVRDKASVVPRGTHVTDSEGTNITADSIEVLEIVSTSGVFAKTRLRSY